MENEKQTQNEDGISLLDLFAVLLRYRKLIICVTLISVALAIAGYFFYPAYQYKKALKDGDYQAKVIFSIKQQAMPFITVSLEKLMLDAVIVLDSLRDSGINEFMKLSLTDENTRQQALFLIEKLFEDNRLNNISRSMMDIVPISSNSVEIIFRNKDVERVQMFIQFLFIYSNQKIIYYLRPDFESMVQNYEYQRDTPNPSLAVQWFLAENLTRYVFLKNVLVGKESILLQVGETIITAETEILLEIYKNKYIISGVVVVFAGFFMGVFLGFTLNIINNIRNNEEAMKKIRDALGNNGSK